MRTRTASGKRLIVLKSRVEERATDAAPGTVVDVSRDHLQIAAGGGTHLALLEIQPEGRRPMPVRDFLAGHPLNGRYPVGVRPHMTAPARTAAFHALVAITAERADLPAALVASRESLTDDRDRGLTATIVTGTLGGSGRWIISSPTSPSDR